jgi:hypothetical protein
MGAQNDYSGVVVWRRLVTKCASRWRVSRILLFARGASHTFSCESPKTDTLYIRVVVAKQCLELMPTND